ncbi:MAG TPA: kelch repeat-containing protein [Bryobacteraceae bacterium]|nr:kelch repeat-containing protein [Bryobacteraceae bacterium]
MYDAAHSCMILYAGSGSNPVFVLGNANGANGTPTWTQLNPAGTPPPERYFSTTVYDPASNRMMVFGGESGSNDLNDVWVLTQANGLSGTPAWIQLNPAGDLPPGREMHNAVYDAANNRMIVFGGSTETTYIGLNDVWVLSNANGLGGTPTWTQLLPSGTPPVGRAGATAIFDPSTDEMVLFGGSTDGTIDLSDVWTLSNANGLGGTPAWIERYAGTTSFSNTPGYPPARWGAAGLYNPGNDELIVFGGNGFASPDGNGLLNDTWILDDANWAPAADLVITALTAPTTIAAGSQANVSMTVANQGTAASETFTVEFYWSQTATITTAAVDSGSGCAGPILPAGSSTTCTVSVNVPTALPPGPWYLGAIADPSMKIPELSKINNSRAADSGATQILLQGCDSVTSMTFASVSGGAAPASQACTVSSGTGIVVSATALTGGNWLTATLSQTSSPATLTITASNAGLGVGTYAGSVTIQATGTGSLSFPVTLEVAQPLVVLSISKSHGGDFSQGLQNAVYTVNVLNAEGANPTSGPVTVTESVPSGLTLVSMSGTGWTCPSGGNTCTRADNLLGGTGYPPIAVTVNVASNATSPQVNLVSVSGGGSATASASDSTNITSGGASGPVQPYLIGTVAGSPVAGFGGDGGLATNAELNGPTGVAVDGAGNLYIADNVNHRVRKVAAGTGIITTVAGTGGSGFSGDNGPATAAQLSATDVAVDSAGNLYIADSTNNRIRKVTVATGIITTVAGGGSSLGDNGPATSAQLNNPQGLSVDAGGDIFIADSNNNRIRKVTAGTGTITTVAGSGSAGFSGDGGPAPSAQLAIPNDVAVDSSGNLYIADSGNLRIRQVTAGGSIATIAGNGTSGYSGDGGPAVNAQLLTPVRVAVDGLGNLFIADFFNESTRKVVLATNIITLLAGQGSNAISQPWGVAIGKADQIFIADEFNSVVTLVNDSGAPASAAVAGNINSSDHLTFNLLVQGADGSQQSTTASKAATLSGKQAVLDGSGGPGATVTVGSTLQYTQTLARDAAAPTATNVTVGESLPPTWTITGCASNGGETCSPSGTNLSVTYPTVATGQAPSLTVVADGPSAAASVLIQSSSTSASDNLATATASQILLPSAGPSVTLSFEGPSGIAAGQQITYTASLSNGANAGAKVAGDPMTVSIALDPNLTNVTAPVPGVGDPAWTCSLNGGSLVCVNLSAIAAGGQTSFAVSAGVSASAPAGGILSTSAALTLGGQTSAPQSPNTSIEPAGPPVVTLLAPANGATGLSTSVTLAWQPVSNATSYAVYFGTVNPPPFQFNTAGFLYSPPALTAGVVYYWEIIASNSSGTGAAPAAPWFFIPGTPTGCEFTLNAGGSANLTSAGTSTGGFLPEVPVNVGITAASGAGCSSTYLAASNALWLTASVSGSSFTYTALSNTHSLPQSATLTITNSSGGSPQTFTVTEAGDTESLPSRQVRALYQSMLGRDPDSSGFAFWTGIGAGGLGQMADSFLTSPEAFNTDFAVMATYQAASGGVPGYAGFVAAVSGIRNGTETIAQLFTSLIAVNPGYSAATLYQNLLSRAPTAAETTGAGTTPASLAAWFQMLIGYPSNLTPADAVNNEFQSTGTFHAASAGCPACGVDHTNGLYIAMLYYTILKRDYDPPGYNFWVGVANSGGPGLQFQGTAGYATRIQILGPGTPNQGFIGSPEFQSLYQ